jgi:hypothetical protein
MNLTIIVPDADITAVRSALADAGFGPNNITVPMRGTVRVESPDQATRWGTSWWTLDDGERITAIVRDNSANAMIVSNIELDGVSGVAPGYGFEQFDAQAGDYIYVPVDPQLIDGLTIGLGELATPQRGLPYAPIIVHPMADNDASLWPLLQLRSEDVVPISLAANSQPLVDVLQAFVDGGGLTLEEMQGLVGAIAAMAGNTIKVAAMIPASWQQYVMTREGAAASGYFGGQPDPAAMQAWADAMMGMG